MPVGLRLGAGGAELACVWRGWRPSRRPRAHRERHPPTFAHRVLAPVAKQATEFENLGATRQLTMLDMRTNDIPLVWAPKTSGGTDLWPATAPVATVQGLGHGRESVALSGDSGLAAPPRHHEQLLPQGSVSPTLKAANGSSYSFEFWFRRSGKSLQASIQFPLVNLQYDGNNGGLSVEFLLPNCIRLRFMASIIFGPVVQDNHTAYQFRYMTQVCDSALASSRWHQVVGTVQRGGSGRIYLNGQVGSGWVNGLPCQIEGAMNASGPWPGKYGGYYCGDKDPPFAMAAVPWAMPPLGLAIGSTLKAADFGSISHVAVYPTASAGLARTAPDATLLPPVQSGAYVIQNTSSTSYFLGRPTAAVVCDDPLHVLSGSPVQRVWMGAWSGAVSTGPVACEPPPPPQEAGFWPWDPPVPTGVLPRFWTYRAVVGVPIDYSPADYPPGSVDEDGLRIDIEEELGALIVVIDPARIEANLVTDPLLEALSPPALRLRVTFSPPIEPASGGVPWGPAAFRTQSALNSAIAVAEQFVAMLSDADSSVYGDRLWRLMPDAPGGVTVESLAPCPSSEDGFALACSSVAVVEPWFIAMLVLLCVGLVVVGLTAGGLLDAVFPDPRAGLAALRAVDPGFDEEEWSAAGAAQAKGGGSPASAACCGGLCPAMAQAAAAPSADQEDAAWNPSVTDSNLVAALRAIRQQDWAAARSLAKRFMGGAAFGPTGVAPEASQSAAMTADEAALVVRAALRPARASMLLVPLITCAVVVTNAAVFVEFCLEQNALGAIFILTWSIDAEYSEAGADVLRRQSLLGATCLGLSSVLHAAVTLVDASAVSPNVVPARWTSHLNVGATLVWLLFLVISALFSRFAAVEDNEFGRLGGSADDELGLGGSGEELPGDSSWASRRRAFLYGTDEGPGRAVAVSRDYPSASDEAAGSGSKSASAAGAAGSAEATWSSGGAAGILQEAAVASSRSAADALDTRRAGEPVVTVEGMAPALGARATASRPPAPGGVLRSSSSSGADPAPAASETGGSSGRALAVVGHASAGAGAVALGRGWAPARAEPSRTSTSTLVAGSKLPVDGQSSSQPQSEAEMLDAGGELRGGRALTAASAAGSFAPRPAARPDDGAVASVIIPAGAFTGRGEGRSGPFLPPVIGGGAAPRDGPEDMLTIEQGGAARSPRG
ncbi:hypothetical protein FNF31_01490 [Cafeteria roenbergensis]|uniref:Uncharacterized protein n=1 Tax=Cafeteria roenbergensis TaxID=33653 RepID=A0A5A8DNI7_CAFRO|nr:hypothetical protein FNF31_01490 [Cafeteria roenbergensis]